MPCKCTPPPARPHFYTFLFSALCLSLHFLATLLSCFIWQHGLRRRKNWNINWGQALLLYRLSHIPELYISFQNKKMSEINNVILEDLSLVGSIQVFRILKWKLSIPPYRTARFIFVYLICFNCYVHESSKCEFNAYSLNFSKVTKTYKKPKRTK